MTKPRKKAPVIDIESVTNADKCPSCAALRRQLGEARKSKDGALQALAEEREQIQSLRLSYPPSPSIQNPSVWFRRADPPIRYVIADRVNDFMKIRLRPLHTVIKVAIVRLPWLARRFQR